MPLSVHVSAHDSSRQTVKDTHRLSQAAPHLPPAVGLSSSKDTFSDQQLLLGLELDWVCGRLVLSSVHVSLQRVRIGEPVGV